MDPEIAELKREVAELKAMTADTNRIVHGMRSSQRWHSFMTLVWWAVIIGATVASYYLMQPYIQKAIDSYQGLQQSGQNAQSLQQQATDFLKNFTQPSTP